MNVDWYAIPVVLLVVTSTATTAQAVAANDEYADDCENANVIRGGTHSGTLAPSEIDAFKIDLDEGDSASVTLRLASDQYPDNTKLLFIGKRRNGASPFDSYEQAQVWYEKIAFTSPVHAVKIGKRRFFRLSPTRDLDGDNTVSFEIFRNAGDGPLCVPMRFTESNAASQWTISFSTSDNAPPTIPSQERITKLQSRLEAKTERIAALEAQLANKTERIAALEAQLTNARKPIEVTVRPGEQGSFVAGGSALVAASGSPAALGNLTVEYGGESYTVGSDGSVEVPTPEAGVHEMTFSHGDSTASAELDVASASNGDGSPTTESGTPNDEETTASEATTTSEGTATSDDGATRTESGSDSGGDEIRDSDGDGMIDSEDYAPNDPEVQEKSDLQDTSGSSGPGFGSGLALLALLVVTVVAARRP